MMKIAVVLLLALVYSTVAVGSRKVVDDIAIQDLNLLLPLTTGKVKATYSLKAYNGCFKWSTTNPEVVTVDAVYGSSACGDKKIISQNPFHDDPSFDNGCSTECVVSVTQTGLDRRSTSFIIAEDTISGRKVRCEVYVDKIHRIEIETTSRRMYHDDIEALSVLAFDSIGNLFSTLEGLQFQWSIVSANPNIATPPLKLIPFAESNIEVSDVLLEMERQGKESHSVLVKGVESGKVYVNTRLIELGYSSVDQSSVMISVLEPLELHPLHPVYLTPGSMLQYELHTFKNEYTRTIPMPNAQYVWDTTDHSVASVDSRGLVSALQLGSTDVVVQYEDMSENNAQGHVTVVWPSRLQLKIVPLTEEGVHNIGAASSNWYLVNGRQYSLTIEVYDSHSHRIMTSPDMDFVVELPRETFAVTDHSRNHARHSITALKEGLSQISARLTNLINSRTREKIMLPTPLVVRQEVVISSPVVVSPAHLRFPVDSKANSQGHSYPLTVSGGTNEYNWYSADNTVSTVDSRGRVISGKQGETKVMAADTKNPSNRGLCTVSVLPVHSIKIIPLQREAFIGDEILLAIAFYDAQGNLFDNCTALSFQWSIHDPSIFAGVATNFNINQIAAEQRHVLKQACTFRTLRALKEGHTTVSVILGHLRTETTFFAYDTLRVVPDTVLISLGSSYLYELHGGPNPWYFEPNTYGASLTAQNPNQIRVEQVKGKHGKLHFRVTCLDHGEQRLTFATGNKATASNPFPVQSTKTAIFSCFLPTSMFIYPVYDPTSFVPSTKCDESYYHHSSSPNDYSSLPNSFSLRNDQIMIFEAALLDYKGNLFNNFTSIDIRWNSKNNEIAQCNGAPPGTKKHQQQILLLPSTGTSLLTAEITGYDASLLRRYSIRTDNSLERLKKEVSLHSIPNVHLTPQSQLLLLHEANVAYVDIIGGSPVTGISSNNSQAITLRNSAQVAKRIEILPTKVGNVQLTINDKCLQGSNPSYAFVRVAQMATITLDVVNTIPVGETTELTVHVFDNNGNEFHPSQFPFMSLRSHQDNELIEIKQVGSEYAHRYQIHGLAPGSASFSFYSKQPSYHVSTETHLIYVYPPFAVIPDEIVLVPGISFDLQTYGGPPGGLTVDYTSSKSSIASVTSSGTVKAQTIGSTIIRAVAEGYDATTNELIQYGESETKVTVRELNNIQLQTPSNVIVVGTEMHAMVLGSNGETPFSYGSQLIFDWSQSNSDVLDLAPRYRESGNTLEEEHMFSASIIGMRPGKSRITVRTQKAHTSILSLKETVLESSIVVRVIEKLEVLGPQQLLLTPYSFYKIHTNLDYLSTLRYSILASNCDSNYNACSINELGEITVSSRTGNCFIQIHEPDTSQSVVLQVEVKPIDAIQIIPSSTNLAVHQVLPLTEQMEFTIHYLDDLSREFHQVHLHEEFSVTSNTQDVVSYRVVPSEQKITVQGLRPGSTIVRVSRNDFGSTYASNRNVILEDFILIRVGNSISPRAPVVHVGGEIHFSLRFNGELSDDGQWKSSDDSILQVDGKNGIATAKNVGRAMVFYRNGDNEISTPVVVHHVDQIDSSLTELNRTLSNFNVKKSKPVKIPLTLWSDGQQVNISSSTDAIQNDLSLSCSLSPAAWGTARGVTKDGEAYCLVTLHEIRSVNLVNQVIPDIITLTVKVTDSRKVFAHETNLVFPFYPEFVIVGSGTQVNLYRSKPHIQIQVKHGLSEITASSRDPNIRIQKVSSHLDLSIYEVQVLDLENSFSGEIFFFSPSTGQTVYVDVVYTNTNEINVAYEDKSNTKGDYYQATLIEKQTRGSSALQFIFILLLTIAALILGYFCIQPSRGEAATAAVFKTPIKSEEKETRKTPSPISFPRHSPFATPNNNSDYTPFFSSNHT